MSSMLFSSGIYKSSSANNVKELIKVLLAIAKAAKLDRIIYSLSTPDSKSCDMEDFLNKLRYFASTSTSFEIGRLFLYDSFLTYQNTRAYFVRNELERECPRIKGPKLAYYVNTFNMKDIGMIGIADNNPDDCKEISKTLIKKGINIPQTIFVSGTSTVYNDSNVYASPKGEMDGLLEALCAYLGSIKIPANKPTLEPIEFDDFFPLKGYDKSMNYNSMFFNSDAPTSTEDSEMKSLLMQIITLMNSIMVKGYMNYEDKQNFRKCKEKLEKMRLVFAIKYEHDPNKLTEELIQAMDIVYRIENKDFLSLNSLTENHK